MKTAQWILIGCRIFIVTCGLTVLGSGCGSGSNTSGGPAPEDEMKKIEESRKAMEAASKAPKR